MSILSGLAPEILDFLLRISLKSAALLALTGILALILGRASGRLRHQLWGLALVAVLILPLISWSLASSSVPIWHLGFLARGEGPTAISPGRPGVAGTISKGTDFPAKLAVSSVGSPFSPAELETGFDFPYLLVLGGWCLGVLMVLGRLSWGLIRLSRLAWVSISPGAGWSEILGDLALQLKQHRRVRLLISPEVSGPMTCGAIRPVIFLPPSAASWPIERRRVVLIHELVHIQRGDALVQVLAEIACALHWWNPLVWLARRRLHVEREIACDEAVVALGTRPSIYATHLLEIASSLTGGAHEALPVAALTMVPRAQKARPTQLEGRLMSILSSPVHRSCFLHGRFLSGLATLILTCGILTLAATDLRGAPPDPDENEVIYSKTGMNWNSKEGRARFSDDGWLIERHFDGLDFYVHVRGDVEFADDGSVQSLEPGASVVLKSSWRGSQPRLQVIPDDAGQPRYTWSLDDRELDLGDDGRAWMLGMLSAAHDLLKVYQQRGQINHLRGQINHLRGQRNQLKGQINHVHGQRNQLKGQINHLRGRQNQLRAQINGAKGQENHDGEGKKMRSQAQTAGQNIASQIAEIEAQITDLDVAGQVQGIEKEIRELDVEGRSREVEGEIVRVQERLKPNIQKVDQHGEILRRLTSAVAGSR